MYVYGMRIRGFSIGCQPMNGLVDHEEDVTGKYWDILIYDRELTAEECKHYSLDYIPTAEK
jgi:hypothetical protein